MDNFREHLIQAVEKSVLKQATEGSWIMPNYEARIKVPKELLEGAWALVDTEGIKKRLAVRIEQELADRIMNHLAAEMATDIKQILSVQERREALREIARKHVVSVMKLGAEA